ncbi:ADP-ribosylation factor-directed GTPase activating protein isoform b [Rhodopirellula sallentina SM41]|uniref:ADP-ribosylation factor-directed GTPase activating protein isoform b n=2 Tax=Rhodopirellula TaxID=265488 RepID=M5U4L2_9BACT|nr:ADP-ribosylation factor-directed GTPase activating protein isoform b [Rhodopirellula sallentina SM41]
MWVMLGCASSTALISGGPGMADDLDWGSGMSFSQPATSSTSDSTGFHSPSTDSIEPGNRDAKVPTFRPTQSVNSVLGLRDGRADWQGGRPGPTGTSIELLPPKRPATPEPPAPTVTAAAPTPPAAPTPSTPPVQSTPSFVTRDNAELRGLHRTWQPAIPTFNAPRNELVLRPVAPEVDTTPAPQRDFSAPRALLQPPQQIATQAPPPSNFAPTPLNEPIPNMATGPHARTVSDRNFFPSWLTPRSSGTKDQAQSRSPRPRTTTTPTQTNPTPTYSNPSSDTATGSGNGWQPRGQSIPPQPLRDPVPMSVAEPMRSDPLPSTPSQSTSRQPSPQTPNRQPSGLRPSSPTRPYLVPDRRGEAVGSGVSPTPPVQTSPRSLAPVQRMPSLDELPDAPLSMEVRPYVETKPEPTRESSSLNEPSLNAAQEDRDVSDSLDVGSSADDSAMSLGSPATLEELPARSNSDLANAHEGNNEGDTDGQMSLDDAEGISPDQVESDSGLVDLLQSPRRGTASAPSREQPSLERESAPELSVTPIKPLRLNPVDPLKPIEDEADLRDVHTDSASSRRSVSDLDSSDPPRSRTMNDTRATDISRRDRNERTATLPADRLAYLDATGRPKSHTGRGAVANLDPSITRMQRPILQTLRNWHARTERADSRSNWGMMHAIMVYGADTRIIARRQNYSAIAWIAGNNVCRGNRLMTTERGKIKIREGTGLQGHQAQFLAVLSLAGVPANYPLYANNQKFAVEDLVQVEAAACEEGKELTFTLIGLSHYLDTDATWVGVGGERWNFERLIAAELREPVVGAACGGTHRLMGFAHALRKRRLEGEPINGQWKRAEDFLDDFVQYTYSMQNRDGSFSTNWFESREDNGDLQRKVQTTGHMLEFLLTHLPDEDLVDPHVVRAVRFIVNSMGKVKVDDAGVGYRGHALRSLAMFHRRVYGTAPEYPKPQVASGRTNQRRR